MEKITISNYYNELDRKRKREFRRSVCEACEIEQNGFYRRISTDGWTKLEREAIERIIKT